MTDFVPVKAPHRRYNPLNDRWVLVSPQRNDRPWQGQVDPAPETAELHHDPACYLCPGNPRANGVSNPDYDGVWLFDNDFPALRPDSVDNAVDDQLLMAENVRGTCRVLCFSPDHSATLPELLPSEVRAVIDAWAGESATLGQTHAWVQLFENKGAMMGCSNPHPHGQIWASGHVPAVAAIEDAQQRAFLTENGAPLLLALAQREAGGPRVVVESADWLAIVPWWAEWPFETLLLPRFAVQRIEDLTSTQRDDLAHVLRELTSRYDNLFACSFPYSMGWHGAPHLPGDHAHWQLHAHFYPPLLRSAEVRKFMVGYELLAEAQRDLTAEDAAARLRAVSAAHYRTARK